MEEMTDRISHDRTSALYAIRLSTVSNIRQDTFEHTPEKNLMHASSLAAQSDFPDPTNSLDTQGYTTTLTREGVTRPNKLFTRLFRMEDWNLAHPWLKLCHRQRTACHDQHQLLLLAHRTSLLLTPLA